MYWRHLCEFKTLPTYLHIIPFCIVKKNILCLDQEEKNEKEKIKSKQISIFVFLDITIMKENINSLSNPKPELQLPYLCLSFKKQKQKLSKLQRQKKIIPVKKIRKLDFDIILITYLLYLALMLCFGQKISFSVL